MSSFEMVNDCPRCGARKITFNVMGTTQIPDERRLVIELFAICRHCKKSTVFAWELQKQMQHDVKAWIDQNGSIPAEWCPSRYISGRDHIATDRVPVPAYVSPSIKAAFEEATACMGIKAFNAAGAMFRLCVDHASKEAMKTLEDAPPANMSAPNNHQRSNLSARIGWLHANNLLPEGLKSLADCVREDGNDGVHDGTLTEEDALDLQDFTDELLQKLYTDPQRIVEAKKRRESRRAQKNGTLTTQ